MSITDGYSRSGLAGRVGWYRKVLLWGWTPNCTLITRADAGVPNRHRQNPIPPVISFAFRKIPRDSTTSTDLYHPLSPLTQRVLASLQQVIWRDNFWIRNAAAVERPNRKIDCHSTKLNVDLIWVRNPAEVTEDFLPVILTSSFCYRLIPNS